MASKSAVVDHPTHYILDSAVGAIVGIIVVAAILLLYEKCTHDTRLKHFADHEW